METIAKLEFLVLSVLTSVLLLGVFNSARIARQERRDGVRRDEIRAVKTQLEQYYNQHNRYPLEFNAGQYHYVVMNANTNSAVSWYIRGQLERRPAPTAAFDLEHNIYYRVTPEGFYDICGAEFHCGLP